MKILIWFFCMTVGLVPEISYGKRVSGLIFGLNEITIKAKSQGEISELNYDEGDAIAAGQVIAVIDDRQEVIERELASVEYSTAKQDYEKTKHLKKYVSQEEVIQKKNSFLQKKSASELKDYNLTNTRVVSPIDGIITQKYFDKGETVSTGDKVFEVVQVDQLVMELHVLSTDATNLKVGQELSFKTELHQDRDFVAKVTYISPVIDAASGTVKIKLSLKNQLTAENTYVLKPGTMTSVDLN